MNLYFKRYSFNFNVIKINENRRIETHSFRHLAVKKTDKIIKYAFQKKNILEKSLRPNFPNIENQKNQSLNSTESLCFLAQGLKSKEITNVRILLNRLGIDLKRVPSRLWAKADWNNENEKSSKRKSIKGNAYGDLIIISPKTSETFNKNQFQQKPWINYIYKQVINFLHYRSNSATQSQILGKNGNNHLQSPFKLSKKDLEINHILGLKTNYSWRPSHQKTGIDFNQVIYPWNVLGSGSSTLENWKDNTVQALKQKVINWEEPQEGKAIDFVEHWNELEGQPVEVLMDYVSKNQFHFVGMVTSQQSGVSKSTYVSFEHHNLYFNPLSKESKPTALTDWTSSYSNTIIDIPFVKISPINSIFLCQL